MGRDLSRDGKHPYGQEIREGFPKHARENVIEDRDARTDVQIEEGLRLTAQVVLLVVAEGVDGPKRADDPSVRPICCRARLSARSNPIERPVLESNTSCRRSTSAAFKSISKACCV